MQKNNSQNSIFVLDRLKSFLNLKTDAELAEFLNVKANTLSTWKSRNSLDYESLISICELYEIDLNFLLLGKESKSQNSNSTFAVITREIQFQYISATDRKSVVESLEQYHLPNFSNASSRAFEIVSNNMFPILEENSLVVCEQSLISTVPEKALTLIVSRKKGIFVGYFSNLKKGSCVLSFENKNVNEVFFDLEDDCEFWVVKAVVQYDLSASKRIKMLHESVLKIKNSL